MIMPEELIKMDGPNRPARLREALAALFGGLAVVVVDGVTLKRSVRVPSSPAAPVPGSPFTRMNRRSSLLIFSFVFVAMSWASGEAHAGTPSRAVGAVPAAILADFTVRTGAATAGGTVGLGVIGLIGWLLTQHFAARKYIRQQMGLPGESTETHLAGQPIKVEAVVDFVTRREHDDRWITFGKHRDEVWVVINGLRGAIAHIDKQLAQVLTLREANGERLDDIATELSSLSKMVTRVSTIVELNLEGKKLK